MFHLPSEIIQIIFEFCIDKRINMDKVLDQFIKGGFNRKNLRILPYLEKQHWCARRFWMSTRYPIADTNHGRYSLKKEWCIKRHMAIYSAQGYNNSTRNIWCSWKPVTKWLENIKKFETAAKRYFPTPVKYLPTEINRFDIEFNSRFYKDRAEKNKKKRKKEEEMNKANLFINERRQLKKSICGFEKHQKVVLSFTMPSKNLKFYKGEITRIWFKEHRTDFGRCIFTKPRGIHRFDQNAVDNYIGEICITVHFEDNDYRYYTPQMLQRRIELSEIEMIRANDKNVYLMKL